MKKILAATLLFATLSANAFFVQGRAEFNQAQGQWIVCNGWNAPIACAGNVYGSTYRGFQGYTYLNAVLYPGQCAYETVWANQPNFDPLVRVWGVIDCRWY